MILAAGLTPTSSCILFMQEISRQLTQTEVLITRAQSLRTKFADEKDRKQLSQGNNMINSIYMQTTHLLICPIGFSVLLQCSIQHILKRNAPTSPGHGRQDQLCYGLLTYVCRLSTVCSICKVSRFGLTFCKNVAGWCENNLISLRGRPQKGPKVCVAYLVGLQQQYQYWCKYKVESSITVTISQRVQPKSATFE